VVVARYLGATLVLPDIRGTKLGNKRYTSLIKQMIFHFLKINHVADT
jgi:hypothetical protein